MVADQAAEPAVRWYHKLKWRPTSQREGLEAERSLLALGSIQARTVDTEIGLGKRDFIHTIVADQQAPEDSPVLVSLAGYSAGSGYHFRVLPGLARAFKVHAVDSLGTGLSGRPTFRVKDREGAEAFFVDALEEWRSRSGISRMVLMGHSLGGYLATRYALQHPERVSHLILVSPAGVGVAPPEWSASGSLPPAYTARGLLFRAAVRAWDVGLTPGAIIRSFGPYGPRLVSGYVRRRFHAGVPLDEDEASAFERYAYHILAARGSGEHALRHLLAPFAWPREALESAIPRLEMPVTFVYGSSDWMDIRAGRRAAAALDASPSTRPRAFAGDREVYTVSDAGHYPFIDNPAGFLSVVGVACASYLPKAAQVGLRAAIVEAQRVAADREARDPAHDPLDAHDPVANGSATEAARRAAEA